MTTLRAAAVWGLILALAILNGALREAVLLPRLGDPGAHLISGALLAACILVVSYLLVPHVGARSARELMAIGAGWFALTLVFEFGFGRLVLGGSWPDILAAYTFRHGNIWPLVLLLTLVAPWLVGRRNLARH